MNATTAATLFSVDGFQWRHQKSPLTWPVEPVEPDERVTLPRTVDGLLEGAVRLWDFGGQEIYHGTYHSIPTVINAPGAFDAVVDAVLKILGKTRPR